METKRKRLPEGTVNCNVRATREEWAVMRKTLADLRALKEDQEGRSRRKRHTLPPGATMHGLRCTPYEWSAILKFVRIMRGEEL